MNSNNQWDFSSEDEADIYHSSNISEMSNLYAKSRQNNPIYNSEAFDSRLRAESENTTHADMMAQMGRRFSDNDININTRQQDRDKINADNYQAAVREARYRRIKMQTYVFLMALARFYLLGMLELNSFVNSITGARGSVELLISVFSYVLFG